MSPDGTPPPPPPPPPPPRNRGPLGPGQGGSGSGGQGGSAPGSGVPSRLVGPARWALWAAAIVALMLVLVAFNQSSKDSNEYSYTKFMTQVTGGNVDEVTYDNKTGKITGKLNDEAETEFRTTGLIPFPTAD